MRALRAALIVLIAAAASGCIVHENHHDYYDDGYADPGGSPPGPIYEVDIDPGEQIDTTPGQGAGVFVEYEAGGRWHVFTACDVELSGYACGWDLVLSASTRVEMEEDDLESDDSAYPYEGDSAVRVLALTDADLDGVWLTTDPGETLRVDALLDGYSAEKYVYWVSGGGMHRGAPSNPLDLVPTAP